MHPIDFEGSNITLNKPDSMTDAECQSIRAWHGEDINGLRGTITVWQPSKEDMEAIAAGRPIYLKTIGASFPPTSLFTFDNEGQPNY